MTVLLRLLIFFPLLTVATGMVGFLAGIPITRWHIPIVLAVLILSTCRKKENRTPTLFFGGILLVLFLINLTNLCDYGCDAMCYHIPGGILLAHGWNPLTHPTPAAMEKAFQVIPETFRIFPTATQSFFLPVLIGAFYSFTGHLNATGFWDIYWSVLAALFIWSALPIFVVTLKERPFLRTGITILLAFNPIELLVGFSGPTEIPLTCFSMLLLISLEAFRRTKDQSFLSTAILFSGILCALKFNGFLVAAILVCGYLVPIAKRLNRQTFFHAIPALLLAAALLIHPFFSNTFRYAAPFYPLQENAFTPPAEDVTPDFKVLNTDAAEMGFFSRFAYAYLSPGLVTVIKEKQTGKPFQPRSQIGSLFEGFGKPFRWFFLISLFLFTVKGALSLPVFLVFISAFLIPPLYMGYGRYLPLFLFFPVLMALNLLTDTSASRLRRYTAIALLSGILAFTIFRIAIFQGARTLRRTVNDCAVAFLISDTETQITARLPPIVPVSNPQTFVTPPHPWPNTVFLFYHAELLRSFMPSHQLSDILSPSPEPFGFSMENPKKPIVFSWPWECVYFMPQETPFTEAAQVLTDGVTATIGGSFQALRNLLSFHGARGLCLIFRQRGRQFYSAWHDPILSRPLPLEITTRSPLHLPIQ